MTDTRRPLIAVITTTIHVPTVLSTYAAPPDCDLVMIVAGDKNTPGIAADYINDIEGAVYLGVDDPLTTRWQSDSVIGYKSIQRRNIALLHAISLGADFVITVDDDNKPRAEDRFIESFYRNLSGRSYELLYTDSAWFDPGRLLLPQTVARGYPIPERHSSNDVRLRHVNAQGAKIGVVAGLSIGDPDIDAIERIVNAPYVSSIVGSRTLDLGTWGPFNTQNTGFIGKLAPIMQVLVGVGRYDDIVMSYIARRIMDDLELHVYYGYPIVHQARNEHDLVKDMYDEMWGYENLPDVLDVLRGMPRTHGSIIERLDQTYGALRGVLPPRTSRANDVWLDDVALAILEGEANGSS